MPFNTLPECADYDFFQAAMELIFPSVLDELHICILEGTTLEGSLQFSTFYTFGVWKLVLIFSLSLLKMFIKET